MKVFLFNQIIMGLIASFEKCSSHRLAWIHLSYILFIRRGREEGRCVGGGGIVWYKTGSRNVWWSGSRSYVYNSGFPNSQVFCRLSKFDRQSYSLRQADKWTDRQTNRQKETNGDRKGKMESKSNWVFRPYFFLLKFFVVNILFIN